MKVYEISMEYQEGYKARTILIDSGASDSVAPPGLYPEIPIYETNASRSGLEYIAAGGQKIPNLCMYIPTIYRSYGSPVAMSFKVAGMSKAVGVGGRIVGSGYRVIFHHPSDGGSYIENKHTGKITPLRQFNGVYYSDVCTQTVFSPAGILNGQDSCSEMSAIVHPISPDECDTRGARGDAGDIGGKGMKTITLMTKVTMMKRMMYNTIVQIIQPILMPQRGRSGGSIK